jgi:hypothetical protein
VVPDHQESVQNSVACSRQTCSGFDTILSVAGSLQKAQHSMAARTKAETDLSVLKIAHL